jgi:hypothetical protein
MSLFRVTITGADDAVDPKALSQLSVDFPFVEWAFLVSEKRAGTPRYASVRRIAQQLTWPGTVAVHLCGSDARALIAGRDHWVLQHSIRLRRIQLNGYDAPASTGLLEIARQHYVWFVLQCRSVETLPAVVEDAKRFPGRRGEVLFDPSGGRGVELATFPASPDRVRLGFAGGIAADNVVDVLLKIGKRAEPFWIDLESGARDQHDAFDLARVRWILEKAAPFVRNGGTR